MKRMIASLLVVYGSLFGFSLYAHAEGFEANVSCVEKYVSAAKKKQQWQLTDGQWAGLAVIGPTLFLVPAVPVIGVPYFFIAGAATAYLLTNEKENHALALLNESSKQAEQLFKKAKNQKPSVTPEEIAELIKQGFDSGEFCKSDKLASPRQIRRYVLTHL